MSKKIVNYIIIIFSIILAIAVVLPTGTASKVNPLGYNSICSFAPISSIIFMAVAGFAFLRLKKYSTDVSVVKDNSQLAKTGRRKKFPISYVIRMVFSLVGFIYALLFTIRGISILVFIILNFSNIFSVINSRSLADVNVHNSLIEIFNNSPVHWFQSGILIFNFLIMIHGIIGVYYIFSTGYKVKPMNTEKKLFYLQILSSVAILIFVIAQIRTSGGTIVMMGVFWILNILISVLGGYHIGKGFYNAGITLGITLSERSRKVMIKSAWFVGTLSVAQIIASFL